MRFNPPPNWPVPPGFTPPPGWAPDSAWGPEPHGWPLWLPRDHTSQPAPPVAEPVTDAPEPGRGRGPWKLVTAILGTAVLIVAVFAALSGRGANETAAPAEQSSSTPAAPSTPAEDPSSESAQETADRETEEQRKAEEAEKQRLVEERLAGLLDPSNYAAIGSRDWQLLERDPDAHAGEQYVICGWVTQSDTNTAPGVPRQH